MNNAIIQTSDLWGNLFVYAPSCSYRIQLIGWDEPN